MKRKGRQREEGEEGWQGVADGAVAASALLYRVGTCALTPEGAVSGAGGRPWAPLGTPVSSSA